MSVPALRSKLRGTNPACESNVSFETGQFRLVCGLGFEQYAAPPVAALAEFMRGRCLGERIHAAYFGSDAALYGQIGYLAQQLRRASPRTESLDAEFLRLLLGDAAGDGHEGSALLDEGVGFFQGLAADGVDDG